MGILKGPADAGQGGTAFGGGSAASGGLASYSTDMNLERELRELEESHLRSEVRSSAESMGALLADEFVEFGSSGRTLDRATVIASMSDQAAFRFRIDGFVARALAPGAALTTYRLSAWSDTKSEPKVTLRCSVWVHRAGRWLLAFHQGTVASGGAA